MHVYVYTYVCMAVPYGGTSDAKPMPCAPRLAVGCLAGLAAARQLLQFGYRVVVVEARDRPGGRVYTERLQVGLAWGP